MKNRPSWSNLNKWGKNRVLKTSYFWFFLVPIAAKALSKIENTLDFYIYGQYLEIFFELPFSWIVFYFSAVAFSIASLIYQKYCPLMVREYNDYDDYKRTGRDSAYLISQANQMRYGPGWIDDLRLEYNPADPDTHHYLRTAFWDLRDYAENTRRLWMWSCCVFFLVGFGLFGYILIRNLVFVCGFILN